MAGARKKTDQKSAAARCGPQSVGRILGILESLAEAENGATLSELAVSTAAPKTSLVGLLAGLRNDDYLIRDMAGRYFLGPRFVSLAARAISGRELITLVRPILAELAEATGETAVLAVLAPDADVVTYQNKVESANPIRYAVTVGERRDLYCTAAGKVLLADFDEDRLNTYLKTVNRQRFTDATVTEISDLRAELAAIRQRGVAHTCNERIPGASGLAAPIRGADGRVIAAILVAGPSERITAEVKRNKPLIKQAAARCSRLMGGTPTTEHADLAAD